MNISQNIESRYITHSAPTFQQRVEGLVAQISSNQNILSISIFGATSNENYHQELQLIKETIRKQLSYTPLITYIAQPLPDRDSLAAEVHCIDVSLPQIMEHPNGTRHLHITLDNRELYLVEGITSDSFNSSIREQSNAIFSKIKTLLTDLQLDPSHIIRQWNYIGNITAIDHQEQHYQAFNDARTDFYASDSWECGYPAATGIGTSCDGVVVSFIAYRQSKSGCCQSIDNPLQIAAHAYRKDLLIGEDHTPKNTPKFERAKTLCFTKESYCFISGTAAIRGEESLHGADATEQTIKTIENIEYLISDKNMVIQNSQARSLKPSALRIYTKNRSDFDAVKAVVENHWGDIPHIYVEADVCRQELLVEIEGIAKGGVL